MATKTFDQFSAASALDGTELLLLDQSSTTVKCDAQTFARSGLLGIWSPDKPASSPHALDYSPGDGVPAALTEWDHGSRVAAPTEDSGGILFAHTGDGATKLGGGYWTVPASEFAFVAKLAAGITDSTSVGVAFFQDASVSTGDLYLAFKSTSTGGHYVQQWNDYTALGASGPSDVYRIPSGTSYMRGRMNGTTIAFDVSHDGLGWWNIYSATIGWTPAHFGVEIHSAVAAVVSYARLHMLRVKSGAGTSGFDGASALLPGGII